MFLVSVGLIIEPSVMADPKTLGTAAVFALSCIGGKAIAAMLCRPVFKYTGNEVGAVFALSVNQAAATLAATFVGYEIGLFGTTVVNAVLIVIVISVILGSVSAARFAPRLPAPPIDTSRLGRRVMVVVDEASDSVAETQLASWIADADAGHLVPLLVHLSWEGPVDESRVEALDESLAGRGFDTKVIVRVDRSASDAVANAAVGQKATIAVVPVDPPRLEDVVFGAEEDRLSQLMPVPMLLALVEHTPSHIVLALNARDVHSPTHHVQVAFDVAARLAKAGKVVSVFAPERLPPERLSHLGGAEMVIGEDRVAFLRSTAGSHRHYAALVPAPPGKSVFGGDMPELASIPDVGLLIAVGSESDDAAKLVTIGRNLAGGRARSA